MIKVTRLLIFCGCLSALLLAQKDQKVSLEVDPAADFSQYRTFDWVKQGKLPVFRTQEESDSPMSDEELDRLIRSRVEKELSDKGLRKTTDGKPDFYLAYFAAALFDLAMSDADIGSSGYGRAPEGQWRPFYDKAGKNVYNLTTSGSLTIDILDGANQTLVWRGSGREKFGKPKETPKKLEKLVSRILKRFPPK